MNYSLIGESDEIYVFEDDIKGFGYNYTIKPSFKIEVPIVKDFDNINSVLTEEEIIDCLKVSILPEDLKGCFTFSRVKFFNIRKFGNLVKFDYDTRRDFYLNGVKEPIFIKFAIDLDSL